MSRHNPEAVYREHGGVLDAVLAGDLVNDRVAVDNRVALERQVVRAVGALVRLQQRHAVDAHGRCSICRIPPRGWRRWPKRTTCTVNSALSFYLRGPTPRPDQPLSGPPCESCRLILLADAAATHGRSLVEHTPLPVPGNRPVSPAEEQGMTQ